MRNGKRHTIPVNQEKKALRENFDLDMAIYQEVIDTPGQFSNAQITQFLKKMARVGKRSLKRMNQI